MSFKEGLESIGDGIKDLSQLNVRTFTGQLSGAVTGSNAREVLDQAIQSGKLEVVALSNMKIDGDIDQFISNDPKHGAQLVTAHAQAVDAAQRSRQAVLEMLATAVRKAVDKL